MPKKEEKDQSYLDSVDPEDVQDLIAVADVYRKEVRRVRRRTIDSRDAYWVVEKPRKDPARIKLSLSRPLSDSEKVYFHDRLTKSGFKDGKGGIASMFVQWQPHRGTYLCDFRPFKVRLSKNEQIYAESNTMGSVRLTDAITKFLEDYFLNIHPVAVKTLRELGDV